MLQKYLYPRGIFDILSLILNIFIFIYVCVCLKEFVKNMNVDRFKYVRISNNYR